MNEIDLLTIIVPIYNVDKYLNRCLDSLVNQSYKNIEILLIDDCATDKSSIIAKKYESNFPLRIKYYKRKQNGGLAAARNTGIELASGDYLSFIDSDDWVNLDFIKKMLTVSLNDKADITICDYNYAWDDRVECQHSVENILSSTPCLITSAKTGAISKITCFILF